jgi:hypothetical protein
MSLGGTRRDEVTLTETESLVEMCLKSLSHGEALYIYNHYEQYPCLAEHLLRIQMGPQKSHLNWILNELFDEFYRGDDYEEDEDIVETANLNPSQIKGFCLYYTNEENPLIIDIVQV